MQTQRILKHIGSLSSRSTLEHFSREMLVAKSAAVSPPPPPPPSGLSDTCPPEQHQGPCVLLPLGTRLRTEYCHASQSLHCRPLSTGERVRRNDSSSESGSGNGLPALTPPTSAVMDGAIARETEGLNGSSSSAPLDFSRPTSSSSSSEDQQPVNLSEPPSQRLPLSASHLPITVSAAAAALLGALHPNAPEELRRKYPLAPKPPLAPHPALPLPHAHTPHTHNPHTGNTHPPLHTHAAELRLDRDGRDYGSKSPQYSSGGSYDSIKVELSAEDLTIGRHGTQVAPDDDDDDHDDHDDNDKINDTEGVDPERLKAFNMFVRLFVDENLDRMVPISKQPKEKIQAIIESCSRQFPEFQERARKRIRTYLKSCRRMKKNGMETRPTPPHLTSAMAENILAAACESESRNAAKRMRLEAYHDEQISLEKPSSGGAALREPVSLAHSAYSLAASAFPSQDTQLYINGAGLSYGYRGYPGLSAAIQHPISLTTGTATQSNGEPRAEGMEREGLALWSAGWTWRERIEGKLGE
ncbi:hypothetical protein AMECASPLE_004033 [Ameca splendens]|uniref:Nucleolar protein 4 helical domain-containing protein n=1 Tax=Ameca splendens TaxID=208324 RepID=A0ABV0Z7J0_9TELE